MREAGAADLHVGKHLVCLGEIIPFGFHRHAHFCSVSGRGWQGFRDLLQREGDVDWAVVPARFTWRGQCLAPCDNMRSACTRTARCGCSSPSFSTARRHVDFPNAMRSALHAKVATSRLCIRQHSHTHGTAHRTRTVALTQRRESVQQQLQLISLCILHLFAIHHRNPVNSILLAQLCFDHS